MTAEKICRAHPACQNSRGAEIINHSRPGNQGIHPAELPGHSLRGVVVNPLRLPGLIVHDIHAPLILIGDDGVRARDPASLIDRGECPVLAENRAGHGKRLISKSDDLRRDPGRPEPGVKGQGKRQALTVHIFAPQCRFLCDCPGGSIADPNLPDAKRGAGEKRCRQYCSDCLRAHQTGAISTR